MSKHVWNEKTATGYVLLEDSRFRLNTLHAHLVFLSQLARPRAPGGAPEGQGAETGGGELAACLALLAEQAAMVLDARPARGQANRGADQYGDESVAEDLNDDQHASQHSAAASPAEPVEATADAPAYRFGVTLEQVDALNLLVERLSAHGDVVAGSDGATLARQTLPLLGQAICDGAEAVREILDQLEAQQIASGAYRPGRVGEVRAIYGGVPTIGAMHAPASLLMPLLRAPALRQEAVTRH